MLSVLCTEMEMSGVYRSAPVGGPDQPDFLNLACVGHAGVLPHQLLHAIQEIEIALGRTRPFPNAPRTIDIDILAYGDLVLDTPELTIPHPRMTQRAFVLMPLVEIAPDWRHPVLGTTARQILADAGPLERIARIGPPPRL
ncbi:MAG: 2-amino-4-hydroxy-6-hydroxymethyldihydropteridine diphosphokinase [Gemmatimonadota bacterium]|nr:2-amino-4-hydroxy-6-hydroxymethyldihydropteridine diphosphokinase [Gemmatimonadota bacterium]